MKTHTTLAVAPVHFAAVDAIHRIVDALRRLKVAVAERRARARAREELDMLDAHALRDLGLSRSEFDSYLAEAWHEAEATRVRSGVQRPMEYGP